MKFAACLRLARFHQPVGLLLLWAPTAWALWIANKGHPSWQWIIVFLLGTVVMRGAGCVINDIADRYIDVYVKRTKNRPLASAEVTLKQAYITLLVLLLMALLLLLQLPHTCIIYAVAALVITFIYPLCKRWIRAPQLILGLAFSMGIPMAFAASNAPFSGSFVLLCVINFCWIVAYDTEYAMVDRADDLLVGVQSTAVWLGPYDRLVIALLQVISHGLWLGLWWLESFKLYFGVSWVVGLGILLFQQRLIASREEKRCFQAFLSNGWYGLIMWLGILQ